MPTIKKIAFLRANGLGDFVFAWPALGALREAFPQANIIYLGRQIHKDLLEGKSVVSEVRVIPEIAGVGMPEDFQNDEEEIQKFVEQIQQEKLDIAIQAHGGGRFSNPFIKSLGAKKTVGLQADGAPRLDINLPYQLYQNEYLRYLEIVSLIGAKPKELMPRFEIEEPTGEWAVLHPGATDPRRRWPAKNFAQVGQWLQKHKLKVVITGTETEKDLVWEVKSRMGEAEVRVNISIQELVKTLGGAKLVVANDTGPLHLANLLRRKTIGIYWVGNWITAAPPEKKHHRGLISWRLECPICGKNCLTEECFHRESFVGDVTVKEVLEAAEELLAGEPMEEK